jgi:antitoxin YefM
VFTNNTHALAGTKKKKNRSYLYKTLDRFKQGSYTCTTNNTSGEDIMRIVNFSEARNNLKLVLDQVINDADYTIITRRNSENAVVMSLETFNSFMETFYLLRSPANAAHLTKSIEQFKGREVRERDLIHE